jgi:hypothetical protein
MGGSEWLIIGGLSGRQADQFAAATQQSSRPRARHKSRDAESAPVDERLHDPRRQAGWEAIPNQAERRCL